MSTMSERTYPMPSERAQLGPDESQRLWHTAAYWCFLAAGIAALPTLAEADDPAPFGNTLTGDRGGWRTR